ANCRPRRHGDSATRAGLASGVRACQTVTDRPPDLRKARGQQLTPDLDAIRREHAELVARHGAWTAHNIRLANGLYTISGAPSGDEVKLRRIVQVVSDLFEGAIAGLRVLDLACLEGMYAIEFARRGGEVVAIEGREANLEKARFAARTLGLDGIDFQLGDVRGLSLARHGEFDV